MVSTDSWAVESAPYLLPCAFEPNHLFTTFRRRLTPKGLSAFRITGHSFRRDAAQHADEAGPSFSHEWPATTTRTRGALSEPRAGRISGRYRPEARLREDSRAPTVALSSTKTFPGLRQAYMRLTPPQ
ncbi:hypothetical protein E4U31_006971 [Claviceps sp. LM219 group G6]|nr:hypothetical protein E4U31_006971 [Claviceps sp. LM219 group G6]